ncbi:V4R domain-containing protein [Paenibacillus prosopidis]|uniref:DNA-binding PucR family transcriptional regulator n=1 Tax=Paenibacillus prosopidis TaxID=630520 RepID=A0A368VHN0_9BACL|nr:V4R domain-containing protein [Paenibacillus prosopidis]RCW40882.1 DNA-binding PucR family transcriptional regulator [Paenibacillus prosopidis]
MNNQIDHIYNPSLSNIVITSHSFGLLRKALFDNLGKNKAKGFLMRFGRDLGTNKAKEMISVNKSHEYLVEMSTIIHIQLGHVSAVEKTGKGRFLENNKVEFTDAIGKWIDSFEAKLHLENHGLSDECSCYVLSGYASGYMSEIYHADIFVKEFTCRAKGDADCTFEVNTREYWEQNLGEDVAIYDDQTILDELEDTYDQLLLKNQLLDKITNYHNKLTDCVAQERALEHVIRTAFEILNIPIVIEDLNKNIIILYGTERNTYQKLIKHNKKTNRTIETRNRTTYEQIGQSYIMTTPIYLENKLFAKCSFIYLDAQITDENDYLFLERLATASALCFLNEKISFETAERLKISILDRLINKQISSITEITSQLKYVSPKLRGPFITLSMKCETPKNHLKPIDLYDQLLQFSKILKYYLIESLLSQHRDEIVILVFSAKDVSSFLKSMNLVLVQTEKNNPDIQYKVGISQPFHDLNQFDAFLKQAEQALHFPRLQKMIRFDEIGFLGTLLQGANMNSLKEIARKELSLLLEPGEKYKELLYTLYIYLVNGGKLEKTMQDLSLSIGGIQYRVHKIEEIIQKDLRNFPTASYLLLLIEALIATGDLKMEREPLF